MGSQVTDAFWDPKEPWEKQSQTTENSWDWKTILSYCEPRKNPSYCPLHWLSTKRILIITL